MALGLQLSREGLAEVFAVIGSFVLVPSQRNHTRHARRYSVTSSKPVRPRVSVSPRAPAWRPKQLYPRRPRWPPARKSDRDASFYAETAWAVSVMRPARVNSGKKTRPAAGRGPATAR